MFTGWAFHVPADFVPLERKINAGADKSQRTNSVVYLTAFRSIRTILKPLRSIRTILRTFVPLERQIIAAADKSQRTKNVMILKALRSIRTKKKFEADLWCRSSPSAKLHPSAFISTLRSTRTENS